MTREQFLAGTRFHYLTGMSTKPYAFCRWPDWKNGDPMGTIKYFDFNEANVTKVGYTYFDCYTSVLYKVVKVRIYFKDLHI